MKDDDTLSTCSGTQSTFSEQSYAWSEPERAKSMKEEEEDVGLKNNHSYNPELLYLQDTEAEDSSFELYRLFKTFEVGNF